jgi:hypothetical protein
MDIVNRICITWLCLFLAWGAVVTYRHLLTERQGIAAQNDMANARASLRKFNDTLLGNRP